MVKLSLIALPGHTSLSIFRGIGEAVAQQDFQKGRAELEVFPEWFDANVLSSDPDTMSDAIMIMPYGMGGPKYRDAPNRYIVFRNSLPMDIDRDKSDPL